jgi:hypothetical protein
MGGVGVGGVNSQPLKTAELSQGAEVIKGINGISFSGMAGECCWKQTERPMNHPRSHHTATRLQNFVVVVGGYTSGYKHKIPTPTSPLPPRPTPTSVTKTCDIWGKLPGGGEATWFPSKLTPTLNIARARHAAAAMMKPPNNDLTYPGGTLYVMGGLDKNNTPLSSVESLTGRLQRRPKGPRVFTFGNWVPLPHHALPSPCCDLAAMAYPTAGGDGNDRSDTIYITGGIAQIDKPDGYFKSISKTYSNTMTGVHEAVPP